MSNTPRGIWIITDDDGADDDRGEIGARSGSDQGPSFGLPAQAKPTTGNKSHIDAADLKANMGEFLDVVEEAFDQAEKSRRMQLEELELAIEISGEGQVSLLGTGGKAGAKGAIKLKFKRTGG
jgi:hypothetical protein